MARTDEPLQEYIITEIGGPRRGILFHEVDKTLDWDYVPLGCQCGSPKDPIMMMGKLHGSLSENIFYLFGQSLNKPKYFETPLDAENGYFLVCFIGRKSRTTDALKGMIRELETLFKSKVGHKVS